MWLRTDLRPSTTGGSTHTVRKHPTQHKRAFLTQPHPKVGSRKAQRRAALKVSTETRQEPEPPPHSHSSASLDAKAAYKYMSVRVGRWGVAAAIWEPTPTSGTELSGGRR